MPTPVPIKDLKKACRQIVSGLLFLEMLIIKDSIKAKAQDRLRELRFEVTKQLDVIVPKWFEEDC